MAKVAAKGLSDLPWTLVKAWQIRKQAHDRRKDRQCAPYMSSSFLPFTIQPLRLFHPPSPPLALVWVNDLFILQNRRMLPAREKWHGFLSPLTVGIFPYFQTSVAIAMKQGTWLFVLFQWGLRCCSLYQLQRFGHPASRVPSHGHQSVHSNFPEVTRPTTTGSSGLYSHHEL